MGYTPYELAGFLGPYGDTPHLFTVMNNPCKHGLCMALMVSSIKEGRSHDKSCILDVGDHEFIKRPTYVVYRLAITARAAHVGNMVDKSLYIPKEDWKLSVFKRIADGLHASLETPFGMIRYARENGI